MSWVFGASFDEMDVYTDLDYLATPSIASSVATSSVTPLGVGKSMLNTGYLAFLLPNQAGKTINVGVYQRVIGVGCFLTFLDKEPDLYSASTSHQVDLCRNASGYLELRKPDATVLATGTTFIDTALFYYFQVTALIDNAGSFQVRINGNSTPDINFSGDTQQQSTTNVKSIMFGRQAFGSESKADSYVYRPVVFNTDGSDNNSLVPARLTHAHMHGTSDGADIWTPSSGGTIYNLIDELHGAPNDADYGSTSTLNAFNRVKPAALSNVGSVAAVQVLSRFNKPVAGTIAVKPGFKAGGTEAQAAQRYLSTGISNYVDTFEYKTGTTKVAASDLTDGTFEITAQVTAIA